MAQLGDPFTPTEEAKPAHTFSQNSSGEYISIVCQHFVIAAPASNTLFFFPEENAA